MIVGKTKSQCCWSLTPTANPWALKHTHTDTDTYTYTDTHTHKRLSEATRWWGVGNVQGRFSARLCKAAGKSTDCKSHLY